MSFRKRAKPMLAASAVARAKSRANEKVCKVSETGLSHNTPTETATKPDHLSVALHVDSEDSNTKIDKEPDSIQTDEGSLKTASSTDNESTLKTAGLLSGSLSSGKRFKKVKPVVNLNQKRPKLDIPSSTSDKKDNDFNIAEDVAIGSGEDSTCDGKNEALSNCEGSSSIPNKSCEAGKDKIAVNSSFVIEKDDNKTKSIENVEDKKAKRLSRTRFKPNVNRTPNWNRKQVKASNLKKNIDKVPPIETNTLNTEDTSKIGGLTGTTEMEANNGETNNVTKKKQVRFTPNVRETCNRQDSQDDESHVKDSKTNDTEDGKNERSRLLQSGPLSTSDPEDGSQSESEGLHHHSKRKFAPCLGPRVRQRKRLSSMTLSDDEGALDGNMTGAANIANESFTIISTPMALDETRTTEGAKEISKGKKTAKKRSRIVIKEPKEKMTMFDYIYYNPQSSEKDSADKEENTAMTRRKQDESNNLSENETVLETLDSVQPSVPISESSAGNDNLNDEGGEEDDNRILAPQVRIGEDGSIIIDEDSLLLKTTRSKMSLEESNIVYGDDDSFDPYRKRKDKANYKKRWPVEETLKFYRVLSRVGTDFSLMVQFFPGCSRRNLKSKFKSEEKYNGDLVDRALKNMLPMDEALFDELNEEKTGNKTEHETIEQIENQTKS
eukprot:gene16979-18690_t